MIKTCFYLLGALALHHTDLNHGNGFHSLFLPVVDAIFFIFIIWQMIFYFTLNNFSTGNHYSFQHLVLDIYDLRYDVQDHGLLYALFQLSLSIIDLICIVLAFYYYSQIALDLISG